MHLDLAPVGYRQGANSSSACRSMTGTASVSGQVKIGKSWSWKRRKHFLFLAKLAAWIVYVVAVLLFLYLAFPFGFTEPVRAVLLVGVLVAMPGSVHLLWIFVPGYFYVSRLRFTYSVKGHISPDSGRRPASSLNVAASTLSNLSGAGAGAGAAERSAQPVVLSVRTDWDQWLFTAIRLLGMRDPGPTTSSTARLEITSNGVELLVGYWRPGVVLGVSSSRVVGIWKGSEIDSIGDSRVLVLVVESDEDVVLFPFQVHRWKSGTSSSRNVDDLIWQIEATWERDRGMPGPRTLNVDTIGFFGTLKDQIR